MKKIIKLSKKSFNILLAICMLLVSIGITPIVHAGSEGEGQPPTGNTLIELSNTGSNSVQTDGNQVKFLLANNVVVGTLKVRIDGETYATPEVNSGNGRIEFRIPTYSGTAYTVTLETSLNDGYTYESAMFDGQELNTANSSNFVVNITKNSPIQLNLSFNTPCTENCGGGNTGGPTGDPMGAHYQLVGYFGTDDGEERVEADEQNMIIVPEDWTNGYVHFKAETCTTDGKITPDSPVCAGISGETDARIEGLINGDQLHDSLSGNSQGATFTSDFLNYGNASFHLLDNTKEGVLDINQTVSVVTEDAIVVGTMAQFSFSLGSKSLTDAIVTNEVSNDISVFYGVTEADLFAIGPNVKGITKVTGIENIIHTDDNYATITFPDLSVSTSSIVTVTIELNNGTKIDRTVKLVRTAISLDYNRNTKTYEAGYVVNKAFLYNNQNHDDDVFDAYLQVILYKDDTIVGYKQVQIDDEKLVNDLHENEPGSIELHDENKTIKLYKDDNLEVNKISVFLTNGPVTYDGNLPTIEFGIGSGVTYVREAE